MYRKGRLLSPEEAVREALSGRYVMIGEKPQHPSWVRGMTVSAIYNQWRRGRLFAAERIEK